MASENLDIIIRADGSDAERGIGGVEGKLGGLKKLAGMAAIGVAAAGAAVIAFGKASLDAAAAMEQQEVAFKTLLGSQEKAVAFLKEAKDLAAKTPFETTDITKAAQTMLSFGIDVKNVIPNIKMLGDVALGNREKFNSLALSFSQVQAAGKLTGGDLLQMINQGFNPLQIMAEKSGKSMAVLREEMEKGKISAEMVTAAFTAATSEGGRFFGGMEAQSTTLTGLVSTLQDAWNTFLQGEGKKLIEWAKVVVQWLTTFITNVLPIIIEQIDAWAAKIGEFLPTGEQLKTFFSNLIDTVKSVITTIAASAKKFEEKTGIVAQLKDALGRLWDTIQTNLVPALAKLMESMKPLMPLFEAIATLLGATVILAFKLLVEVLTGLLQLFTWLVSKAIELGSYYLDTMEPAIKFVTAGFEKLTKAIGWVIEKFNGMKDAAISALEAARNAASMIPGVGSWIGGSTPGKADGGHVTVGKPYMVGERGPEMFVPGSSGTIVPNHAMGGAMEVRIMEGASVSVRNDGDIRAIADAVATELARTMQSQRNGLATAM